MTTKKSVNSSPLKRYCIRATLKCYLIWILGVVSLRIFGMSKIWIQGHHSWCAFSEAVFFSSFYASRVLGLGSSLGGKHASAQLREEKEMGTKERGLGGGASNSVGKHEFLQCAVPDLLLYSVLFLDRLDQAVLNLWDSSDPLNQLPQELEL